MKHWVVKPICDKDGELPEPWSAEGCVLEFRVDAKTAEDARKLAAEASQSEGEEAWLNSEYSSCVEVTITRSLDEAQALAESQ